MTLLNTPMKIGKIEIKNRLVMPPMATAKAKDDGKVSRSLCEYYEERAKGGYIGLIILEHSFINPVGKASKGQISFANDYDKEGLQTLVSTIHNNHTKVFAQLNHAGGKAKQEVTGYSPLSASAVAIPGTQPIEVLPKEMTEEDIQTVIDDFVQAALRAKVVGFDGVEIHAAHGYLLNQFFSPLTNKRRDQYTGKTLEGRMKLHIEIIKAIREAVGETYPIAIRLGACDYMDGGVTIQDSIIACKKFEEAGVDLLDISGGFCTYIHPEKKEQGYFRELSEAIKQEVSVPVIVTGGIVDGRVAEQLLKEGVADMIGVGRAILKDVQWAKHAMEALENIE